MTTATAKLCGHRWPPAELFDVQHEHRCTQPANHPAPCTCRCGATTTTPDGWDRVGLEQERESLRRQLTAQASGFLDATNRLTAEREDARRQLADAVQANQRWAGENADLQAQLEAMTADRDQLAVQRDRALGELEQLRADHLLIPKDRLIGYRVRAGYTDNTTTMYAPADVEIVVRDDPGQEERQ